MLDQNTDRSWWTIGAIFLGGTILTMVVAAFTAENTGIFPMVFEKLKTKITGALI